MENLKYRRQFLLTPIETDKLQNWQVEKLDGHTLYVHPDCSLFKASSADRQYYLVGYFLNPHQPEKDSQGLLEEISCNEMGKIPELLYPLVGRFVLIIKEDGQFTLFNDACGLKMLFYTKRDEGLFAASQPLLFGEVTDLKRTADHEAYFNSTYVARDFEHWLPSGVSFYEGVHHLIPNHYVTGPDYKPRRFWPTQKLQEGDYAQLSDRFARLLKQTVHTAHKHMDLAFSLTAGWDSRIITSCCKDILDETMFYTLRYRKMDDENKDIRIPKALAKKLNLNHSILDCQKGMTEEFSAIYTDNSDMAHLNDCGYIAYGMYQTFPQDKVAVKGNCSEIGRCFYYSNGKHRKLTSASDIVRLEKGWSELDFINRQMESWYAPIKEEQGNFGYDLLDLFYWEHRMGSWQAQSQLEWDVVQEVFSPFSSRELLDLMFAINSSYRKASKPRLYVDTMKMLWPEVLSEPINPHKRRVRIFLRKLKGKFCKESCS